MRKKIPLLIFCLAAAGLVRANETVYKEVIENFRAGNYMKATTLLESIKPKDAGVYYYLGLAYFRRGDRRKAASNFLAAYYVSADSKWGRAALENYRHLTRKLFSFDTRAFLAYDGNVSYSPDIKGVGESSLLLDLYASGAYHPADFAALRYAYSGWHYLSGLPSMDGHSASAEFYGGFWRAGVSASHFTSGGSAFYGASGVSAQAGFLGAGVSQKKYYDALYDYLDGREIYGRLGYNISGVDLSYTYADNSARNLERDFTYRKHTGSIEDEEYKFNEVKTSEKYSVSHTYDSHTLSAGKSFAASDEVTIRVSGSYSIKNFRGANEWYREHWIEDTSTAKWYYWAGSYWQESSSAAPGAKQTVAARRDGVLSARISASQSIGKGTLFTVFYEHTANSSNINDGGGLNYNWSKGVFGAGVTYGF